MQRDKNKQQYGVPSLTPKFYQKNITDIKEQKNV